MTQPKLTDINQQAKEIALEIKRRFPDLSVESVKNLARFVTFARLGIAEGEAFLQEKHGPDFTLSTAGYSMIFREAMLAAKGEL